MLHREQVRVIAQAVNYQAILVLLAIKLEALQLGYQLVQKDMKRTKLSNKLVKITQR